MDGAFLSEARMWATGTGADVMKRLAAPQVGGVFSAMLLTLLVMPAIYTIWRWHAEVKRLPSAALREAKTIRFSAFRIVGSQADEKQSHLVFTRYPYRPQKGQAHARLPNRTQGAFALSGGWYLLLGEL